MSTMPAIPIVRPYTPELLPTVQREIEYLIQRRMNKVNSKSEQTFKGQTILELGSGWSTIWFGLLGCEVISFEHDKGWYKEVKKVVNNLRLDIVLNHIRPEDFRNSIEGYPNELFDFIYVDCIDEQREACIIEGYKKLKQDGYMIVDDSHWESIATALMNFSHWNKLTISGNHLRKTSDICFHQTTIMNRML